MKTEAMKGRHAFVAQHEQRFVNLELLDVFGEVTRCHALVNMLLTGEIIEFLNACFYIMTSGALALHDRCNIDLMLHFFIGADCFIRDVQAQIFLSLHHGNPKFTL